MRAGLFIDGDWVAPGDGGTMKVVNPSTEEVIHTICAAGPDDVDLAVKAARRRFDDGSWSRLPGARRAAFLRAIARDIRELKDHLARLEVIDNGKPLPEAEWDIGDAAGCFDFYAGLAEELDGAVETVPLSDERFTSKVAREPVGVVGAIIPWNYPLLMAAWKVAPALAAGCCVVLKPAETTSLTALELAAIADAASLPSGVLNVVTGTGPVAGQALVDHPGIDKLAFTGSTAIGSRIMAAAARDVKRVSLELGGKSPFLVFDDADIEAAVEWIMFGIFWNQGEVCSATSRVLIHEPIYARVVDRLVEEAGKIRIGDGLDPGTLLGPLVSKKQFDAVASAVEKARLSGASILAGGRRPPGKRRGFFYEPTIIADAPLDGAAWREEIFGPVVCVRPFSSEDEAVALANDSRFGLAAAVMSKDIARTERVAAALRAGIVWINCSQPTFTEAPWGGYKQSGIGRELGRWGLENYLEVKQITRYASDAPWGWYMK